VSEQPNVLNELLTSAADAMRRDWSRLVAIGCKVAKDGQTIEEVSHALAKAGNGSQDSIKRKLYAIQHMQNLGYSEAEIVTFGQTTALSEFAKSKKADNYEKQTSLIFKIPGSQREVVQIEIERIKKLLNLQSSESFWDWFLGQTKSLTDEELQHSAGGAHAKG
jgi:hypothetical protein